MWGQDPHFKGLVQHHWSKKISGSWMYQVVTKLRSLKQPLRELNRNRYSDIEKVVGIAKLNFEDLQCQLHMDPSNISLMDAESVVADTYRGLTKAHYSFLSQKSKVDWVSEGDENSSYFHNQIRARQIQNKILQIKDMKVHKPTVKVGPVITDDLKVLLLKPVTKDEIKTTMFSIPASKSPGPDGFTSQFYRDSWDIVGHDVVGPVKDFLTSGNMLKQVNTTTLTLIPKVKNPTYVLEYRPIACCNTLYKCIAKILCARLSEVLPHIVDRSQGGFIRGRNIVENVLICQDLVRLYNRKAASPRCLIKIDFRKAYDTVEWDFLHQMLTALNFPPEFIHLIMICVSTPSYTLNVNGNSFGFFQGTAPSIMWLLRGFSTFSSASGLCLNREKTNIYFNGVRRELIDEIVDISGFKVGSLPFKYFGILISSKKISKFDAHKLIERIVNKVRSLGARQLSYAGRLELPLGGGGGKDDYLRAPNIAWDKCCTPKEEGGLGIKNAKLWNRAALGKYTSWLATKKDHLWVKWVNHVYMKGCAWVDYTAPLDCNWAWKKIVQVKDIFKVGYLNNILNINAFGYSIASGYKWLRSPNPKVPWRFICWNSLNVPRTSFIYWASLHKKLLTRHRLVKMGICSDISCCLCNNTPETHEHIFQDCDFSRRCMTLLQQKLQISFPTDDIIKWFSSGRCKSVLQKLIAGACYVSLIYAIWMARNRARIQQYLIHPKILVQQVWMEVKERWQRRNCIPLKPLDAQWMATVI
ncbi:uncharacterized protein LOC141651610 [Silene latifolia]|uniref:uncharacterized protein LOC141651610 n=1 Tax=Silene latifolia TaxID=37657 RepID=UPI003D76D87E